MRDTECTSQKDQQLRVVRPVLNKLSVAPFFSFSSPATPIDPSSDNSLLDQFQPLSYYLQNILGSWFEFVTDYRIQISRYLTEAQALTKLRGNVCTKIENNVHKI